LHVYVLPPSINIRYFRFVKQMYLDIFSVYIRVNLLTKKMYKYICFTKLKHLIIINRGSSYVLLTSKIAECRLDFADVVSKHA
jgi:hypothetical protein